MQSTAHMGNMPAVESNSQCLNYGNAWIMRYTVVRVSVPELAGGIPCLLRSLHGGIRHNAAGRGRLALYSNLILAPWSMP
jgi:hypothetical protein